MPEASTGLAVPTDEARRAPARLEQRRAVARRMASLWAVTAVVTLGAVLRLYHLTFQSLWFDELFSVVFSAPSRTVTDIVRTYAHDVHPLLYPLLLHVWLRLFGATDLAARLLSALAGIAALPCVFLLGRRVGGALVGVGAALLAAVNPFLLAYSQEARSYALLTLFAAWSTAALLDLDARHDARRVGWYVLPAALAVHTHYYGLILVGAQLVAAAVVGLATTRRARALVAPAAAAVALVVLYLPWASAFRQAAGRATYWPAPARIGFFGRCFARWFGDQPAVVALAAVLLLALPLLLRRRTGHERDRGAEARSASLLAITVAVALLVPFAWSLVRVPILIDRCTIIVVPAVLTLIALAAARLPGQWLRAATLLVLSIGCLVAILWTTRYYTTPTKDQWREAARWAAAPAHRHPGDRFVSQLYPGFAFYFAQDGVGAAVEDARPWVLKRVLRHREPAAGVWLLVYRQRAGEPRFRQLLESRFRKVGEQSFLATRAEYWVPRGR